MQRRILVVGIFLVALVFVIGLLAITARGDVNVTHHTRTLTILSGDWDLPGLLNDTVVNSTVMCNATGIGASDGVWIVNYSINITGGSLTFDDTTANGSCRWVKLNASTNKSWHASINVTGGTLYVNNTMVTGWNDTGGHNATLWGAYQRPSIMVRPATDANMARAYFKNSTLGYLGWSKGDNQSGITYKDANIVVCYRPSGWVHNCTIMENFIGVRVIGTFNINVTDSWFNDSKSQGIIYERGETIGGFTNGSNDGYIGDFKNSSAGSSVTDSTIHDGVTVLHTYGSAGGDGAEGILLMQSNNIEFDHVNVTNCTTKGIRILACNSTVMNNTIVRQCTNAVTDYNIHILDAVYLNATNCTAHTPDGAVDGGNWYIGKSSSGSAFVNLTDCSAYGATTSNDFYIGDVLTGGSNLTRCTSNNSYNGFVVEDAHNNTFYECTAHHDTFAGFYGYSDDDSNIIACTAHNITNSGFRLLSSKRASVVISYARYCAYGIFMLDSSDADIANNNNISGTNIYNCTQYGISIGTYNTTDNWCHNNTVHATVIRGTSTGHGICLYDNATYNILLDSDVRGCTASSAIGIGTFNDTTNTNISFCEPYHNYWDWDIYGDADIYGFYILSNVSAYNADNFNNISVSSPFNHVAHEVTDAEWRGHTLPFIVNTSNSYCHITRVLYTRNAKVEWYGNATGVNAVYHQIGRLRLGRYFDLDVDNRTISASRARAMTAVLLGDTMGRIYYNYTGTWTIHYFEQMMYVAPADGNGNGAVTPGNGVADDELIGVEAGEWALLGVILPWYLWLTIFILLALIIIVVILLLLWQFGYIRLFGKKKKKKRR